MVFEFVTMGGKVSEAGGMMGVGGMEQRNTECLAVSESSILDGSYNTRRICLERGLWESGRF